MITVVETFAFMRRAKAVMTEAERTALIDLLAADPEVGVSLGRGLWKVRFAREGEGKAAVSAPSTSTAPVTHHCSC